MRFKHPLLNQKQLGLLYGVSSHEVGRWLVAAGMRDEATGKPSREAHRGGYCDLASTGPTGWAWSPQKVIPLFRQAGHRLPAALPDGLVEPSVLNGPFVIQADVPREVMNADGTTALVASSATNAEMVLKLLQLAHKWGAIARLRVRDGNEAECGVMPRVGTPPA